MNDQVLVIGGGIAGVQTALDLADAGARVILVERSPAIGGKMAALDKNFPTLDCSICIEAPKLSEVEQHPNIELLSNATVARVDGEAGNFTVQIKQNGVHYFFTPLVSRFPTCRRCRATGFPFTSTSFSSPSCST